MHAIPFRQRSVRRKLPRRRLPLSLTSCRALPRLLRRWSRGPLPFLAGSVVSDQPEIGGKGKTSARGDTLFRYFLAHFFYVVRKLDSCYYFGFSSTSPAAEHVRYIIGLHLHCHPLHVLDDTVRGGHPPEDTSVDPRLPVKKNPDSLRCIVS